MNLNDFINNKTVYLSSNLIDKTDVHIFEKKLGISFGEELTQYILRYGYLGYKSVELYGINKKQMEESDLVKQTEYLHRYFPKTLGYLALENMGDGKYAIVSSDDDVFEYSSEEDCIKTSGLKLNDYILGRFQKVDDGDC